MVRDTARGAADRENGKLGGNRYLKDRALTGGLTPALTLAAPDGIGGRDNAQIPEVRSQKPEAKGNEEKAASVKSWRFSTGLYVSAKMHDIVTRALGPKAADVDWGRVYAKAAADYAEHGEPEHALEDLKKRGRAAIPEYDPIPSAEETRRRIEAEERAFVPMTPEQRAKAREQLRGVLSTNWAMGDEEAQR
jgi:hypothetical protein